MPFIPLVSSEIRRRRILISGPPNHWKTTSLLTMPAPRAIISSPGEKGYDTIPTNDPETKAFIWQANGSQHSASVVKEVMEVCMACIAGKHGKLNSLGFDGAHKFFNYMADSVTDGAWFEGREFDAKIYAMIYREYEAFWSRLLHTPIPVIGVTSWSDYEGDRPRRGQEKSSDIPSHIWPDLPGKMAKRIFGEFSVTVHAIKRRPDPNEQKMFGYKDGNEVIMWQTRPAGEVLGCGVKGDKRVVAKIPLYVPADYQVFEDLWTKLEKENAQ